MTPLGLYCAETSKVVVSKLEVADGFWSRFAGLQLRRPLSPGHGLLLVPCSSVHTCMLRFPLDLVMLDREGKILECRTGVRPWSAVVPKIKPHAVLEMTAAELSLPVGHHLRVQGAPDATFPRSLQFLQP